MIFPSVKFAERQGDVMSQDVGPQPVSGAGRPSAQAMGSEMDDVGSATMGFLKDGLAVIRGRLVSIRDAQSLPLGSSLGKVVSVHPTEPISLATPIYQRG